MPVTERDDTGLIATVISPFVIARSAATKQSTLPQMQDWIASHGLHRGRYDESCRGQPLYTPGAAAVAVVLSVTETHPVCQA
jgi:hypothetical protein